MNWLFVDASADPSLYKMRSGRMSVLMTGFALPGLTESSESKSCEGSWELRESN